MNKKYLKPVAAVFKAMLERGVDPHSTCIKNHPVNQNKQDYAIGRHTVEHVIISSFKRVLPEACAELIQLLRERIEITRIERKQQTDNGTSRKRGIQTIEQEHLERKRKRKRKRNQQYSPHKRK